MSSPDELARLKARVEVYRDELRDRGASMAEARAELKSADYLDYLSRLMPYLQIAIETYVKLIKAEDEYVSELEKRGPR